MANFSYNCMKNMETIISTQNKVFKPSVRDRNNNPLDLLSQGDNYFCLYNDNLIIAKQHQLYINQMFQIVTKLNMNFNLPCGKHSKKDMGT